MSAAALLLIGLVTALLSALLASKYNPLRILDVPNARSLHARPTPRTGGLAILAGMAMGWSALAWQGLWTYAMSSIVVALLIIAAISFTDDVKQLSPLTRLLSHIAAAGTLLLAGVGLPWNGVGALMALLAIVWMVNLYNFMDGMDGFAAGMTVSGFFFLGLAGMLGGNTVYAWFCWTVAAAACGFLLLNFPPARIFMGDVGSTSLGLLAAACSLWGMHLQLFAWWYPVLVFTPFIVDATVTLVRRIIHGEKVWQAHKTHYYQRLVQLGWGHRKTVLVEYAWMAAGGLLALWLQSNAQRVAVAAGLVAWAVICAVLLMSISQLERKARNVGA